MSIPTDMDWEIRTTGNAANGAGYTDLNPGTSVDYSQQDAAQLSLTDIASDGAGTAISSVTGGFTAAMVGNVMYIAGSGFITGWYQITGYTDTNNVTIDRSCGSSASNGTGNVGGAWLPNQTDVTLFFSTTNKGGFNTCHWGAGTYTGLTGQVAVAASSHKWIGYNTTRGDAPIADDRPFVDFSTGSGYVSWGGSYGRSQNMRFYNGNVTAAPTQTFRVYGIAHVQLNCKVVRAAGTTGTPGMSFSSDYGLAVQGEYVSDSGTALVYSDESFVANYCYFHDSYRGAIYTSTGAKGGVFNHCIFDTITNTALSMYFGSKAINCTFYNVTGTGFQQVSSYTHAINCIFHTCGVGIYGAQQNMSDNNIFYNNVADFDNGIQAGEKDLFTDPLMVDPANQDFSLEALSPCLDTGFKLGAAVGLP